MSQDLRSEHRAAGRCHGGEGASQQPRGAGTQARQPGLIEVSPARRVGRLRGWAGALMLTLAAALLVLSACNGSTTTTVPLPAASLELPPEPLAGRGAGPSGAGGARAGEGAPGSAGSPEPMTPQEPLGLACGPVTCPQPLNLMGNLLREALGVMSSLPPTSACCLDSEQAICGTIEEGSGLCEPAAKPDPKCPGIDLSALAAIVGGLGKGTPNGKSGCCTHNACGIDGQIFGRGCIRNEEMSQVIKSLPVVGPLIVVPGAADCVSPDGADPEAPDAGS